MTPPHIVFALARGQNRFFHDLAEALIVELTELGASASIIEDELPSAKPGVVGVLMPPHEFVALSGTRPHALALSRFALISAEQPTTSFFDTNVAMARDAGAVLDINERAVRAYRAIGVAAEHLQLGYSKAWDRRETVERDIDVLFLGRSTGRRERLLASYADSLERLEFRAILSDNLVASATEGPNFVAGENKLRLLARAKVLLNIHGEEEPYFEWLRVAEAMSNGCAIVTEHSTDMAPLRPGRDIVTGRPESLALLAAALVDDERARKDIVSNAEALMGEEANLTMGAKTLLAVAERIDVRNPVSAEVASATRVANGLISVRRSFPTEDVGPVPTAPTEGQRALRGLKQLHREFQAMRRRNAAEVLARNRPERPRAETVLTGQTPAWSGSRPRVSVIIPLFNDEEVVHEALDSVLSSTYSSWEILVVDDASTDGSPDAVRAWMERNPSRRCAMVRHEVNRGLSAARNTGIADTRGEFLLMLDSDNLIRRFGLARLVAALEEDPSASFAYGILDRFSHEEPIDVISKFGWEPVRLRLGNYIDALALFRRTALDHVGGYSEDPRLALGLEDYDLWARLSEAGHYGAFIRRFAGSYRVGHSSMLSVTGISSSDAVAAIAEHAPKLMRGIVLPP